LIEELETCLNSKTQIPYLYVEDSCYINVTILAMDTKYIKFKGSTTLLKPVSSEHNFQMVDAIVESIIPISQITCLEKVLCSI